MTLEIRITLNSHYKESDPIGWEALTRFQNAIYNVLRKYFPNEEINVMLTD